MIKIVGGTYRETTTFPSTDQFFGSGGRAAAALSYLSSGIELHTYIDELHKTHLEGLTSNFGFNVHTYQIPQTIIFAYEHPMSRPTITPSISNIQTAETIRLVGTNVLRYGLIEGDAVVQADRVVYDPQNGHDVQSYEANGSTARELALVLNLHEGNVLTGETKPSNIIECLKQKEEIKAIVLKLGPLGALVWENGKLVSVPVFKTGHVWPIGSGDVFSAIFAHYWMEKHIAASKAAYNASLATAYYCSTRSLPIPSKIGTKHFYAKPQPLIPSERALQGKPFSVYLARPFFTMAQLWMVQQSREALLNLGFTVFSPIDDIGRGPAKEVAPLDIKGLENSDVVFAILDGLDTGTIYEIGYARSLKKPVVVYAERVPEQELTMLIGTDCIIVRDFATALYSVKWAAIEL